MVPSFAFIDRTEPVSPTRRTTTSGPRLQPDVRHSASELREFGEAIYKQVWDEFYKWEPGYASDILGDIKNNPVVRVRGGARKMAKSMAKRFLERSPCPVVASGGSGTSNVVITEYATGSGTRTTTVVPISTAVLSDAQRLAPHPPYECCPPINRSILVNDVERSTAKFLPYAEDESFPVESYLKKFEHLEWAQEFDPDFEMIQLETTWRLHVIHGLSISDITRMHILKPTRISHNTGLLWDCMQRDFLQWPGASQTNAKDGLPIGEVPLSDDLHGRLTSMLRAFCPSRNCLGSLCLTHAQPHSAFLPLNKPRITGASMILSEGHPCGPDCFRLVPDIEQYAETLPPPSRDPSQTPFADNLHMILGIAPDLFPCQLAVMCFKPCKEVFVERVHLFPDNTIFLLDRESSTGVSTDGDSESSAQRKGAQHKKKKSKKAGPTFANVAGHLRQPVPFPCAHPGECTTARCQCYSSKFHCQPSCRCGVKCVRQWPACTCQQCGKKCPCRLSSRECIPGICVNCGISGISKKPCSNTKMQRLYSEPLEVKIGSYGLGAFAMQDIADGNFVGTYAGHVLSNNAADLTGDIRRHNHRNYLFEFEHDSLEPEIFDAARVGNATRFLNHRGHGEDNVGAENILVNGEHQIGFFAKKQVKAGEELFLDYGDTYWTNNNDDDEPTDEKDAQDLHI